MTHPNPPPGGWGAPPGFPHAPPLPGAGIGGFAPAPPMPPRKPIDMGPGAPPPPAPRDCPFSAIGWNERFFMLFGGLFGGIPTFIFAIMLASFGGPWDDWILNSRGVSVDAEVVSVEPTNTSINDRTLMEIHVKFEDKKGKTRKTSVTGFASPAAGSEIKIEYDPESISRARTAGGSSSPMGFMILMPLVFGGIGFPMFFIGSFRALRQRSIYRRGTPAQARVVDITASASSQNRQRVMIAHYHYETPTGLRQGEIKSVSPPMLGSVIWVLFDPQRPERSVAA